MPSLNIESTLKFIIISVLVGLLGLSPNLNIIPRSLIVTSFHDSQRLIELVLVALVVLYSITFRSLESYLPANKTIHIAFCLLIALTVTSSFLAISPRHALLEISLFTGLTYLSLFISNIHRDNSALLVKQFTYLFWAGILLSMVAFYVGYITATVFKTAVTWPGPITGFNNVRFFNQYQLWTLGLITLPVLGFNLNNTHTRRWLHFGLVLWWVLLFHSASRGVLLAWCAGILVTAVIYRKSAWPFIRLQLFYMTAGFLSYQILFQIIPHIREFSVVTGTVIRDTTYDRIELWNQSFDLIRNYPIFGAGPMHFAWYNHTSPSAHPHNSVLQIISEWGLPAAFLMFTITLYGLRCWLKKFNLAALQSRTEHDRHLAIILSFTIITNAAYSLVDGVIVMPISQVMMFTIIGLMLRFYHDEKPIKSTDRSLFKSVFACLTLITLIWSALPEILQSASGSEKRFSINYTATSPRIWIELR